MTIIGSKTLNVVSWVFTGLAVLLTAGRLWIRSQIIRKYGWDDAAHLLALLLLLAQVSISSAAPLIYQLAEVVTDDELDFASLAQLEEAALFITWTCCYAVKIAFLLLYRSIFHVSTNFVRAWWTVLAFVILSYSIIITSSIVACGGPSAADHPAKCNSLARISYEKKLVIYSYVLNISSDLAIMILPLGMLKSLKMPTSAKLGLVPIFCCAIIIITIGTVRTAKTLSQETSNSITPLWLNLESAISVIVSCLPVFPAYFKSRKGSKGKNNAISFHERSSVISKSGRKWVSMDSLRSTRSLRDATSAADV